MKSLTETERDEDLYNPQGLTEEERATCPWVQMTLREGLTDRDTDCVSCPLPYDMCWIRMADDPDRKEIMLDFLKKSIRECVGCYMLVYHEN